MLPKMLPAQPALEPAEKPVPPWEQSPADFVTAPVLENPTSWPISNTGPMYVWNPAATGPIAAIDDQESGAGPKLRTPTDASRGIWMCVCCCYGYTKGASMPCEGEHGTASAHVTGRLTVGSYYYNRTTWPLHLCPDPAPRRFAHLVALPHIS